MSIKPYNGHESVSTDELNVGDVVINHGTIFLLTTKNQKWCKDTGAIVYWFRTSCLDGSESSLPPYWRQTWTIQGNYRATWCRINEDSRSS